MKLLPCVAAAILLSSAGAKALEIGDRAPPLDGVAGWLNGAAVNPAKADGTTVYVVELWATWCGPCRATAPHLAEMSSQFKTQGVVVVGLTLEDEAKVKPFVESLKIPYLIAMDPKKSTAETWMKDVEGIPHAFIVATNGVIVWTGHPMDGMREALVDVLHGTYDPEKKKKREEMQEKLAEAIQSQNFDLALKIADQILAGDPKLMEIHQLRIGLLTEKRDLEGVRAHHRKMLQIFADAPKELNDMAWSLAAPSPLPIEIRDLEVALSACRRAAAITEGNDPAILDTQAMVYHAIGLADLAIATQKEALARVKDPEIRKDLQTHLAFFESAQRARSAAGEKPKPAVAPAATPQPAAAAPVAAPPNPGAP